MTTKICLLFAAFLFSMPSWAEEIRVSYTFPSVVTDDCYDGTVCRPWHASLEVRRLPTFPVLPVRVARILVPVSENVVSWTFIPGNATEMSFTPENAELLRPISKPYNTPRPPARQYFGEEFPSDWVGAGDTLNFRGYKILQIPLYPFRMKSEGTAVFITSGELVIETEPTNRNAKELFRKLARDTRDAGIITDYRERPNETYPEGVPGYLIIGPKTLVGELNQSILSPIINEKKSRGLNVEIANLETISPKKDPKQIREYIKTRYKAAGIDYVLLVGDKDMLPWKKVQSGLHDDGDPVPTDQYYACLDGDFGSPEEFDWSCEVAVGRVGVNTPEQLSAWVDKHMQLVQIIKEGRTKQIFNFGEALDGGTFGGRNLDWLETGNGGEPKPPATVGFPSYTKFTKLYDSRDGEVSSEQFLSKLSAGDFHVLNHLGHANATFVFKSFMSSLMTDMPKRPAFYYSEGCYANDPDEDNATITLVRLPKRGPAAMIANTRYGWYEPGESGEGTSSVLHRVFWSMRFKAGIKNLGFMNHKAKEIIIGVTKDPTMVYTLLESTLIGDPELNLGI